MRDDWRLLCRAPNSLGILVISVTKLFSLDYRSVHYT
jgi:hypothetical protein